MKQKNRYKGYIYKATCKIKIKYKKMFDYE